MGWRYLLQRLDARGPGEFFTADLPIGEVVRTRALSAPGTLKGTLALPYPELISAGRSVIAPWTAAIHAEQDGQIKGSYIVTSAPEVDSGGLSISATSYLGYAYGMAYTGATFFVEADAADVFRHIWEHLQSFLGGNIGLQVASTMTGVLIGQELEQVEFDTESGPVSFEAGPIKFADYLDQDLGEEMDGLAERTPFDFVERHAWNAAQTDVDHWCDIWYPKAGRRRNDLRFVVGENVWTQPMIAREGETFSSGVVVLGAGEGRDVLRTTYERPLSQLRRIRTVTDKAIQSLADIKARAEAEWRATAGVATVDEVVVTQHSNAQFGTWDLGDEIFIEVETAFSDIAEWYRIVAESSDDNSPDRLTLSLIRSSEVPT